MTLAALLLAAFAAAGEFEPPKAYTLGELEQRYVLEVVESGEPFPLQTHHGAITGADAPAEARQRYAVLLGEEFGLYPPAFVGRSGLKRIVLCRDLDFEGQRRAALPAFASGTLYLDVLRGAEDPLYPRRVIHHEFFHLVDWRDDGQVYGDDEWTELNEPDFRYGSGGVNSQDDSHVGLWTERHAGFLSEYGRSGVEEDKAELWSFLLVHPRETAARSAADALLLEKVELMRERLQRFSKDLDSGFWAGLQRLERPAPRRDSGEER